MPIEKDEKVELEMLCLHGENAVCTNCLPPPPVTNAKHMSYNQYINEEKLLCQHPHDGKHICVHCIPPLDISYKIKPGCNRHKPWPEGLCSDCKPPIATLKRQTYRHVDYVEFLHVDAFNKFLLPWSNYGRVCQRMGIMLGYYEDDDNYIDGIKAVVQEIYEPCQDFNEGKVVLLEDPLFDRLQPYLFELGLEPIGWIFTHETRDYLISSNDMEIMYKMQSTYKNPDTGLSKFVTVSVSYDEKTKQVSPDALMLSDQGMALYRDKVIGKPKDPRFCYVREQENRYDYITDVIENKKGFGAIEVKKFDPDFLIVQVNCGAPKVTSDDCYICPFEDFTPLHRDIFGELPSDSEYMKLMNNRKQLPKWKIFGDFHMLCYTLQNYDEEFFKDIIKMVKNKSKDYVGMVETFVASIL